MNLALSKEIYGINTWCVDQHSFPALMKILNNASKGVSLELPEEKYNSIHTFNIKSKETRLIGKTWQLENTKDFIGIGIINLNGVITVSGGASSRGVDYLKSQMNSMAKDDRIKSFIVLGDSGGGSAMAVELMSNTIKEIDEIKPVYGLVKEGGMAASACYGIMSACRSLWAESEMSIIGSSGTMIQFEGRKANTKKKGVKYIRLYAPKSTHKNKGFEDALNNDDYKVLTDELLKPFNERFLSLLLKNRPLLKGTDFDNGHTLFAKDGVGTFIDGLKSFEEVLSIASGKVVMKNKNKSNINPVKMNKTEFKAENPEAYEEIFQKGVSFRTDQVGSWLAHIDTDPEAVVEGIESGENLSQSQREKFFVKQNNKTEESKLKKDNPKIIDSPEAEKKQTKEDKELKEAFDFKL